MKGGDKVNHRMYRGFVVAMGVIAVTNFIVLGLSNYMILILPLLIAVDTFLAKLREEKDKGERIKEISNWNPTYLRRAMSIIVTATIVTLATIILIYIKENTLRDYIFISVIWVLGIVDIKEKISPIMIYENGIQIGLVFAEWKDIEVGETYRSETLISYRTKRALGGNSSIRIMEDKDLNEISRRIHSI